jgi:hypothetical protein
MTVGAFGTPYFAQSSHLRVHMKYSLPRMTLYFVAGAKNAKEPSRNQGSTSMSCVSFLLWGVATSACSCLPDACLIVKYLRQTFQSLDPLIVRTLQTTAYGVEGVLKVLAEFSGPVDTV